MQADPHLSFVRAVTPRTPQSCEECLWLSSPWLHLRLCMSCGHVGGCGSSPLKEGAIAARLVHEHRAREGNLARMAAENAQPSPRPRHESA